MAVLFFSIGWMPFLAPAFHKTLYFILSVKHNCTGNVGVALNDEKGNPVPLVTVPSTNGLFDVNFTPQTVGTYTAQVLFDDDLIPGNPFHIKVGYI